MMKQIQSQKLQQKLSPQQIQYIKLLEIPTVLLENRIKQELVENPALSLQDGFSEVDTKENQNLEYIEGNENTDIIDEQKFEEQNFQDTHEQNEISLEEYISKTEENDYRTYNPEDYYDDEDRYEKPIIHVNSMREDLMNQLGLLELTELEYLIGQEIIGELDDDGYLRKEKNSETHEKEPISIQSITDYLVYKYKVYVTDEMVENVLKKIQTLDPPGIAARDLRECLMIQLHRNPDYSKNPTIQLAYTILKDFFEELTKKHFEKIISKLNITSEELKQAINVIKHLNFRPGAKFDTKTIPIIPDFILTIDDKNQIHVQLNKGNSPSLKLDKNYMSMLEKYQNSNEAKETYQFVKNKIDEAKFFIEALQQRSATLYKIMMTIVDKQKDFFLSEGDESKLKPMILEDVANEIGVDISTVSRSVNSKYVECPFGIYELKFFFSSSITTESGEEISNKEVKKILKEIIDNEDKSKPYSDDKLEKLLKDKGYDIARRTIAKYREQMGIPVARLRKEI